MSFQFFFAIKESNKIQAHCRSELKLQLIEFKKIDGMKTDVIEKILNAACFTNIKCRCKFSTSARLVFLIKRA